MTSGKKEYPDTMYNLASSGVQFEDGYAAPELVRYTGLITNVVNISPIKRQPSQSERISLVIAY